MSYAADVAPILQTNCFGCHPPNANFDALTYAGLLTGGDSGLAVLPNDPVGSLMVKRLRGEITPVMPLGFGPLAAEEIDVIERWIAEGAQDN